MTFPSNDQFKAITVDRVPYADVVNDMDPASIDIVGNANFPSFYFAYDEINVYFRMRVRSDPRNFTNTSFLTFNWGALFNTTGVAGTYDWLLAVNGLNNRVNLIKNVIKEVNSWNDPAEGTDGRGEPSYSRQIINFDVARVVQADSSLGRTQNFFIDFLVPASIFFSTLGITPLSRVRLIAFTSADENTYNRDSLRISEDYQFQNAFSNSVTIDSGNVKAKLQVTKALTSGPTSPIVGQNYEWTGKINVRNIGKSKATIVNVTDAVLIDVVSMVEAVRVSQGTTAYNPATKTLSWTIGNIEAGGEASLNFLQNGVFLTPGSRVLNIATAIGFDNFTGAELPAVSKELSVNVQATGGAAGNVLDSINGQPVNRATVRLLSGATEIAVTQTDEFGDYNFSNIPSGSYNLEISKDNYNTSNSPIVVTPETITIVNAFLVPIPGNVEGTVVSSTGPVLDGATVFLSDNLGNVVAQTTTSLTGQYSFSSVNPGHYIFTATADGFQSEVIGENVLSNQTSIVNFILLPNPGMVEGTITGSGGPIEGALVEALSPTGIVITSEITNGAGQYFIGRLAPGAYRIRVSAPAFQTTILGVTVVAGETEVVNVDLLPNPGALTGTVTDEETGAPLPDTSIKIVNSFGLTSATVTTNMNGKYLVNSLAPGNYVVTFSAEGHGTKTVSAFVQTDLVTTLDLALRRLVGVLTGIVTSEGVPIAGASVDVVLNNSVIAKTVTDENGTYTINGLSPDRYTVIFSAEGFSPTTLGAIIQDNQTFTLLAELQSIFGSLTGNVSNEDGDNLPGAVILVKNSDSDVLISRTVTDTNGNYSINKLQPGSYVVTAAAATYQTVLKGAIITASVPFLLDFVLAANPSTLTGTVINEETGEPISGASIQVQLMDTNGVIITTTFSDQNGEFIIEDLVASSYSVIVNAEGFTTASSTVRLLPGSVSSINIAMAPLPGYITGTLRDGISELPIAGATIKVSNTSGAVVDTMLTSTNGEFLSVGLSDGIYTLTAIAEGYQTKLIGAIVSSGITMNVDIELSPNPGSIIGTVFPVADEVTVQIYTIDNQFVNSTAATPSGEYQFQNLAPGNYIIKAVALNYSIGCTGAIVISGQTTTIPLTLVPNPGSVSGTVFSDLGTPLPNVTLSILDLNETPISFGNTDRNGVYMVSNIPVGSYVIIIKAPEYTTTTGSFSIGPGQEITNLDFVLERIKGSISGSITDFNTGDSITGATILLRNSTDILLKNTTTDQFGNFLLKNLAPGSYSVTASAPTYSTEISGVIVKSGETAGLDIKLRSLVGSLSGQVTDENGIPLNGDNIQIKLLGANGELLQALLAQPDGSFQIPNLSVGTYFVSASFKGYSPNLVSTIILGGEVSTVSIPLSQILATLTGRVFDSESGEPITGTAVSITLLKQSGLFVAKQFPNTAGIFSFTSISPGIYLLNTNAEGYGNKSMTVTLPEAGLDLEIPLTKNPGALTGYVTNELSGEPLSNAIVSITTRGKILDIKAVTDRSGQFTVSNLSPASYRAVVSADGFSSQSATFVILSDQTTSLSFILTPEPGFLIGTVTDSITGNPIPQVNIQVRYLTPAGPVYASTLTDDQGNYLTQGLFSGTYTVIAFAEKGYGSSSASVLVPANDTKRVDFMLEPLPSVIEGTIREKATSNPVPNVFVRLLDIFGSSIQIVNSDMNGFYRFEGFTAGQYLVSAIFPDFQRVQVSVNPLPGETVIADIFFLPEPGRISGVILDAQTGSPLVGAQVEVFAPESTVPVARRTAGASGNFLIEGVVPGSFTINAYTLNYSIVSQGIIVRSNLTTDLVFRLIPNPSSVSGTVVNQIGIPLSNVSVRVIGQNDIELGNGITDIDGNFAIGNLTSGNFTIIAGKDGYADFTTGISVLPGQTYTDLNIVLRPVGGTFTGRVVSEDTGEGLAGVLISILTPERIPIISTNTDPNGNFTSILLSPGTYNVIASSPDYVQKQTGVTILPGETTAITFILKSLGGTIFGKVVDNNGDPITDTTISIRLLNNNGVLLQSLLALQDGTFEFPQLSAASYQVNVAAEGYQTSTVGAIVTNGEITELTVPLTVNAGTIVGVIQDKATGLPISGSFIEITDVSGNLVATVTSDQNGAFTLQDIQVGSLNVRATASRFGALTIGVIVKAGETSNVQLFLTRLTGGVKGFVIDSEGNPIPSSSIKIKDETNTVVFNFLSDDDGSFQIGNLIPGNYMVLANAEGFSSEALSVGILANQVTELIIVLLLETGFVQGNVTNLQTGEPLIGASVQLRGISPFGPVISSELTDSKGNYSFGFVSAGSFTITVTKENFGNESGSFLVEKGVTNIQNYALKPNPSSVKGVVTSGGTPLVNTLVRLVDEKCTFVLEVQTDKDGRYQLQNFTNGTYTLVTVNPDYQSEKIGFSVGPGQSSDILIEVTALPGVLIGTITDQQTTTAIQGAVVQVFFSDSVQPLTNAVTDDEGNYIIRGLAPGAYNVTMAATNYRSFKTGINIVANETTSSNGSLLPNPGVITGAIKGVAGSIAGASIRVVDVNGAIEGFGVTDAGGTFAIGNLSEGTFPIIVTAPGHASKTQGITVKGGEQENIEFSLLPQPGKITGSIINEEKDKLSGTVVNAFSKGILITSAVADKDGVYTINNLEPETYQVNVNQPGYAVSSIGAVVRNDIAKADLVLAPLFGSIKGTVVDQNGNPVTDRTIHINLYDQSVILVGSVLAQSDGSYVMPQVKQGNYFINVNTKGYTPNTLAVFVDPEVESVLNLPIETGGGELTGTVINSDSGEPLSGVLINIMNETGMPIVSVISDQNGLFTAQSLPAGMIVYSGLATGFSNESRGAIIESNGITETVLSLSQITGDVSGSIIDSNGVPLGGASIQLLDYKRSVVTSVLSQSDGTYAISDLLPGIYTVLINYQDLEQKTVSAFVEANELTISNVQLGFLPGSIEGIVTNSSTGAVLSSTNVELRLISSSGPVVASTLTDSQGRYFIQDIPSGDYSIVATNRRYGNDVVELILEPDAVSIANLQLSPTFAIVEGNVAANTSDPISSGDLPLLSASANEEVNVLNDAPNTISSGDLFLSSASVNARGDVPSDEPNAISSEDSQLLPASQNAREISINEAGSPPLPNTLLRLANQNGSVISEVQTDNKGNFLIEGISVGNYSIVALNPEFRNGILNFTAVPNMVPFLNFNLTAVSSQFAGEVIDAETGLPIPGAIVEVFDLLYRPITVGLTNTEGFYDNTGLNEGTYVLRASAQGYGTAARISTLRVNDRNIEIFTLVLNPSSIAGTVIIAGNGPLNNASVSVYDEDGIIVGSSSTNPDGSYIIGNLSDGRVTVSADADGYKEESTELVLTRGENRTGVDFALRPGEDGDITGQVTDSQTKNPLADVLIQLFELDGNLVTEVRTNEAGVFLLLGERAGSYNLRASKKGYVAETVPIILREGDELLVPISLKPVGPPPPIPGVAQYYIIVGRNPLSLDSVYSPTPFVLEKIDSFKNCAVFSYEAIVTGGTTRRFVTFDLTCIDMIKITN
ncbi:carboxypeptidase regulatory-like domain-containing protein [Fictibacillus nanhaiensis]|uniref:carboxypeptidase regulatory-like domain-containing protein n=1 Tax=Fictibacillus nanhaiensis TaxID=742169 RepID=UPI001C94826D|nr:carboxypeptidase regulatory-like domain-containing protein [Fictibacillus nanhaiensis]MBY6036635.1 carboxypeptidase regulatory-like domain-containing protein [Fictibacillus nanhaiensis]